jgi:Domain of unknown function (DUF1772)
MHLFDTFAILCVGLMIGNEFAVSVFVNPVIWKLDDHAQAKALSMFARLLGKAMPLWYAMCLVLMIGEAYQRRHEPALILLVVAVAVWIAIIVFTVFRLLPINNRIASLAVGALPAGWLQEHKRWDMLHRWRILFLVAAMICLVYGILMSR